jgi:hypothetical protein
MKSNKINISKDSKDKLFRMILMLFPKYGLVKLQRNERSVILRQRKLSFKSIKLSLLELLLYYIPNEISLSRWGNYDLVYDYAEKVRDVLNSGKYNDSSKMDITISYLYGEFLHTKIRNIYANLDEVTIPLEQGGFQRYSERQTPSIQENYKEIIEDATVVKGDQYSFIKTAIRQVPYYTNYIKLAAAGLFLGLFLQYKLIFTFLSETLVVNNLLYSIQTVTAYHAYPWIIIRNTS